jgi:hypothetical protein
MTIETRLSRGWLIRTLVFIAVWFGLAIWAYYDATIAYPERGEEYATFVEYRWLSELASENLIHTVSSKVADPAARLDELKGREPSGADRTELEWLVALDIIGRLDDATTRVADPRARLAELDSELKASKQPKKLNRYDIPIQWLILAIGLILGVWTLVNLFKASRRHYTYDKSTGQITINGQEIPFKKMTGIDMRKWQKKSIAMLETNDGSFKLDAWVHAELDTMIEDIDQRLHPGEKRGDAETPSDGPADEADGGDEADAQGSPEDADAPDDKPQGQ